MSNGSDDKGDVDAALRRLEGQINPKVLLENSEKVNGWVRNLQERMANGDYENSIFSEDEVEDFIDCLHHPVSTFHSTTLKPSSKELFLRRSSKAECQLLHLL